MLQAGKHVLVEKPLATSNADARAILAAANQAGVKFMVDFHARWHPLFTEPSRTSSAVTWAIR
jgi:predicted dehydrogenase